MPTTTRDGYRLRWYVLAVVLVAEVMDLLDATVVAVAAPTIQRDLGGGSTVLQWVAAGYTLAFAVGLVTGGRLGDLHGRRRMFLVGLAGFVATSALCGLAGSPELLVAARVAQGLFGAVLIPQGFALLTDTFPGEDLGRTFAFFGPVMALSAVAGPVLAGALIGADVGGLGWRAVFLVNVPIGLAALAAAAVVLPESRGSGADGARPDPVGTLLVSLGLLLLVLPLVQGREWGWPAWSVAMAVASVPVLALFARQQVRRRAAGRTPLVEPALFARRAFTAGLAVILAAFAALVGLSFVVGLHLQLALGYDPLGAALAQAPFSVGIGVGAVVCGAGLGRRYGRPVLQAGALLMAVGALAVLPALGGAGGAWGLAPGLLTCGLGAGLLVTLLFDVILSGIDTGSAGSASGVLNAVQQVGSAVGVAVLGTVLLHGAGAGGAPADTLGGAAAATVVAAVAMLATAALAGLLPRRVRPEGADVPG